MSGEGPVHELDLLAYADGRLDGDPARRERVAAYLKERPEEAARVAAYAEIDAAIRDRFGPLADEPVPPRLYRTLDRLLAPRRPRLRLAPALQMAAAAALLLAGLAAGWMLNDAHRGNGEQTTAFVEDGFRLYRTVHPLEPADPGDGRPLDWLSSRISLELRAPDLSNLGYRLIDRRLAMRGEEQYVELVYRGEARDRLLVLIRPRWEETGRALRVTESDGLRMAYWTDGPLAFGVVGSENRRSLSAVAAEVRRGVEIRPGGAGKGHSIDAELVPGKDGPLRDLPLLPPGATMPPQPTARPQIGG